MRAGATLSLTALVVIGIGAYVSQHGSADETTVTATRTPPAPSPRSATAPAVGSRQLAALRVAPEGSMYGYQRDAFGHGWATAPGGCSTRVAVLVAEGDGVQVRGHCTITAGTWRSLYDGATVTDGRAGQLDIDHLVPLAEAWRSGASQWTEDRRRQFANDRTELIAVTRHSNRSKSDAAPDGWRPTTRASWCTYATRWTAIKTEYGLTVTVTERTALADMLTTCTGHPK